MLRMWSNLPFVILNSEQCVLARAVALRTCAFDVRSTRKRSGPTDRRARAVKRSLPGLACRGSGRCRAASMGGSERASAGGRLAGEQRPLAEEPALVEQCHDGALHEALHLPK